MSLWLVRAGKYGEHEQKFLSGSRIYLTWERLENYDLLKATSFDDIKGILRQAYPDTGEGKIANHAGQVWAFVLGMKPADWIAVPLKGKSAVAIGEIQSDLEYDPNGTPPYYFFSRRVKWLSQGIPRSAFDPDILYSLSTPMTICQIKRNDAEKRVRQMAAGSWASPSPALPSDAPTPGEQTSPEDMADLEQVGRDRIARHIIQKFKGHGMARLVDAVLKAQGYSTYCSPEGPDKGVDILAAPGPLGFGHPRICVQVKSQESPVDRPTLDQLIGTMQNVHADQGLLVAWGGFKSSVYKEVAAQFFRVRLWDQDALVKELLEHYDEIDEDLRAEIPLKRIWTLAAQEDAG